MQTIRGDITTCTADYIVQQCNCLTVKSHGLSATLEKKFVHANVYSRRRAVGRRNLAIVEDRPEPGTMTILEAGGQPSIVCLFGQWRPGKVRSPYKYPNPPVPETAEQRLVWFRKAMLEFCEHIQLTATKRVTIAIPYKIGCGLAGGDWADYQTAILAFAAIYADKLAITLYQL